MGQVKDRLRFRVISCGLSWLISGSSLFGNVPLLLHVAWPRLSHSRVLALMFDIPLMTSITVTFCYLYAAQAKVKDAFFFGNSARGNLARDFHYPIR